MLTRVADGVSVTVVPLGEYDVRGALIVGSRAAVVWDTLSRPRDMQRWLPLIEERALVIVYSHADWDHIWGTGGLPYDRARIVAHALTAGRFETDVPRALAEKRAAEPSRWDDVVLVPPSESFIGETMLDLGNMTLVLRHLPGHTSDCTVGLIPERGILLAGDTVETPCPVVPADSPLADWVAELRRWSEDPRVRTVIPAHGRIGGREIILENVRYLEALLRGTPVEPQGELTPFYRETHHGNLQWNGASRSHRDLP